MATPLEAVRFAALSGAQQDAILAVMTMAQKRSLRSALEQIQRSPSGLSGLAGINGESDGLGFLSSIAKALSKVVGGITGFLAPVQTPTLVQVSPQPAPAPASSFSFSSPAGIALIGGGVLLLLLVLRK